MIEKILLFSLSTFVGLIGYLFHQILSDIRDKQKQHSTSLYNLRESVVRIEAKQNLLETTVSGFTGSVRQIEQTTKDAKNVLDHNLYELRQQIKEMRDAQYDMKANYGKVILLVENLYRAKKQGGPSSS